MVTERPQNVSDFLHYDFISHVLHQSPWVIVLGLYISTSFLSYGPKEMVVLKSSSPSFQCCSGTGKGTASGGHLWVIL